MAIKDTGAEEARQQAERGQELGPQRSPTIQLPNVDIKLVRLFFIAAFILIGMSLARPETFPTLTNFRSMSVQFPEIGILALAIMITMLSGGIDLSVTAIANFSGILAAFTLGRLVDPMLSTAEVLPGILVAIAVAISVGALCGLFNGLLVAYFNLTPILATLGTLSLYTGFSYVLTKGSAIFGVPQLLFLGGGDIVGVPIPLLVFAALALMLSILLGRTAFGFKLYMLGSNPVAARFSGLGNKRLLVQTYVISGVLGAVTGLIFLARNNSAKADYGSSYILQAILVAILGGVNPYGGFGKVSGLVLAILSLQFLSTGLNMLLVQYSGSAFFREFAFGALLLLVMALDNLPQLRRRRPRPGKIAERPAVTGAKRSDSGRAPAVRSRTNTPPDL
jgi:simple sugar transport system permease protein